MSLMFPKSNSKKERGYKKQRTKDRRTKFWKDCLSLDGKCQNFMVPHERFVRMAEGILDVHHILGKDVNLPDLDQPWNGITLCRSCHDKVHRIPGYMLWILDNLKSTYGEIRQQKALDELKKKEGNQW